MINSRRIVTLIGTLLVIGWCFLAWSIGVDLALFTERSIGALLPGYPGVSYWGSMLFGIWIGFILWADGLVLLLEVFVGGFRPERIIKDIFRSKKENFGQSFRIIRYYLTMFWKEFNTDFVMPSRASKKRVIKRKEDGGVETFIMQEEAEIVWYQEGDSCRGRIYKPVKRINIPAMNMGPSKIPDWYDVPIATISKEALLEKISCIDDYRLEVPLTFLREEGLYPTAKTVDRVWRRVSWALEDYPSGSNSYKALHEIELLCGWAVTEVWREQSL